MTTTVPVGVRQVVSSTKVRGRYRREATSPSTAESFQRPSSGVPSRAAKTEGESKRGKHSQSTLPSRETSGAVRRSESKA